MSELRIPSSLIETPCPSKSATIRRVSCKFLHRDSYVPQEWKTSNAVRREFVYSLHSVRKNVWDLETASTPLPGEVETPVGGRLCIELTLKCLL